MIVTTAVCETLAYVENW